MSLNIAFRSLRRTPGFTLLAISILALGIGATTAIFSVVNAVILRPLAYKNPARIVALGSIYKGEQALGPISGPNFLDLERHSTAFEAMAAYESEVTSVVTNSIGEFAGVCGVSPGFLRAMGIQPVQGRAFVSSDWKGEIGSVALVSESYWSRHFGNQPFTGGRKLKVYNFALDIIGILPAGFHFPEADATEIWVPVAVESQEESRSSGNYRAVGRLKPGVPIEEAQAQLTTIAERLAKTYPGSNKEMGVRVMLLGNYNVRNVKTSLYILLGAVLLVLLIACANVANLLLARGAERMRELSIRAALGASRSRLMGQLFTESLVLGLCGSAGGIFLSELGLPAVLGLSPKYVPRLEQVRIDLPVLAFCLCAAIVASIVFGLAPALNISRVNPNESLRSGSARGVLGGRAGKLRQIFVTAEVALSVVLVVSAGLLLKSFAAITHVQLGFHPERLLVAELGVPEAGSASPPQHAYDMFFKPLLARLSASPQVEAAALSSAPPGNLDMRSNGSYIITGQTMKDFTVSSPEAGFTVISPDYFRALGIPLIAGRSVSDRDDTHAPFVAIISETLARRSFPHQNPIGRAVRCGWDENSMNWMTIVGVVGDVRIDAPNHAPNAEIYMPYLQHRPGPINIVVKDGPNPFQLTNAFRGYVRGLNPDVAVKFSTMENRLSATVAAPRFNSVLISLFAALALMLALIGIYGVMAYSVTQRTPEIGLRLALGADRGEVVRMILAQSWKLLVIGLLIGSAGAIAASRILKSQLFGVSPADPATYLLTLVLLVAAATLASFVPAWHASRTEPLEALRQE